MAKAKRKQKSEEQTPPFDWQRAGRWAVALLLFSVMGAGAAWGVMQLRDPNVVPLKVVRIDGQFRHLQRSELERAVGQAVRGNFFTVDVERIRAAAEALPWVDTASVRRVWPDTLVMSVEEQQPLAVWDKTRLVNRRGEVFAPQQKVLPEGLPAFMGPDEDAKRVVKRFTQMKQQLQPLALSISQLALDRRGAWTLGLESEVTLKLGHTDVDERLQRFIRIYPALQRDRGRRARMVDLRYTNGVAVDWQLIETEETSAAAEQGVAQGAGISVRMGEGQV